MAESPAKTLKTGIRKISGQQFRQKYAEVWSFLKKSRSGETFAFCSICNTDFSVAHSGRFDCKIHVSSYKHKKNELSSIFIENKQLNGRDGNKVKHLLECCQFFDTVVNYLLNTPFASSAVRSAQGR